MDHVDERPTGDWLRRERTRRHFTLAQVSQATKIRERFLEAIENDNFEQLPHPVVATGFIQIYARFLGFDPDPFLRAYRVRSGVAPSHQVRPETTTDPYISGRSRSLLVPVVSVIFLLALAAYLYQQVVTYVSGAASGPLPRGTAIALSIPTPLPSPPLPPSPSATPVPATPTSVSVAQAPTPTTPPLVSPTPVVTATPEQGVRIDAEVSGRVWLQVESDGKIIFSGILMPGEKRTWTATKSLMLWSGNAGNIQVTYNGKSLGALGPFGKVMKVTWTAPA